MALVKEEGSARCKAHQISQAQVVGSVRSKDSAIDRANKCLNSSGYDEDRRWYFLFIIPLLD